MIKTVLVIYKQNSQDFTKVEKSVKEYFKGESIEIIKFIHINNLNVDTARILMTATHEFKYFGREYPYWDLVVDCVESYFNPQFIKYSVIRNNLNRKSMLKSDYMSYPTIAKTVLIDKIKNTALTSEQLIAIYKLLE